MSRKTANTIKLDKVRKLRYNFKALELLEEMGVDIIQLMLQASDRGVDISASKLKKLVFAGLLHNEPELQLDDVTELMDHAKLGDIIKAVVGALTKDLA